MTTLDTIAEVTTAAGKLIGSVVWWTQTGSETLVSSFELIWLGKGLPPGCLPPQPPPARALRDAGHEVLKGYGNKRADYLMRPAGESGGTYFYGLVSEENNIPGDLQHHQAAKFAVDSSGNLNSWVYDPNPVVAEKVAAITLAFNRIFGTYQPRDIRDAVMRALKKAQAVPLRDHGGIYWVPAPFQGIADALKEVVESLGEGDSSFHILPIHSTAQGNDAVGKAARASLEEELKELASDLGAWALDAAHGDGPRPSSVAKKVEDLDALSSRVALYKDILELTVSDLETKLEGAQRQAAAILGLGSQ